MLEGGHWSIRLKILLCLFLHWCKYVMLTIFFVTWSKKLFWKSFTIFSNKTLSLFTLWNVVVRFWISPSSFWAFFFYSLPYRAFIYLIYLFNLFDSIFESWRLLSYSPFNFAILVVRLAFWFLCSTTISSFWITSILNCSIFSFNFFLSYSPLPGYFSLLPGKYLQAS